MELVTEENITDLAVKRWQTAHDPRTAELLTALVRHLHAFAREVRLTEAEWMAAVQWLDRTVPAIDLLNTPPARTFIVEEIVDAPRQSALAL